MNTIAKLTSAVLCGLALTACGGGGDSPKPLAFHYETQPLPNPTSYDAADVQTLLNQEGAKGYFYHENFYQHAWYWIPNNVLFVDDGSGKTYTYKVLDRPSNMTDFLAQANAEGAKGYRYEISAWYDEMDINVYRKDSDSSATYTYVATMLSATMGDFLAQANEQGRSGFLYLLTAFNGDTGYGEANVYMKNNASNAVYVYNALALPAAADDFLVQLNSEGTKGYRALAGDYGFNDATAYDTTLYVKDKTQAAAFAYQQASGTIDTIVFSVDQKNSHGAQGYAYWGALGVGSPFSGSTDGVFYVMASNCSGWMCTASNPITFLPLGKSNPTQSCLDGTPEQAPYQPGKMVRLSVCAKKAAASSQTFLRATRN